MAAAEKTGFRLLLAAVSSLVLLVSSVLPGAPAGAEPAPASPAEAVGETATSSGAPGGSRGDRDALAALVAHSAPGIVAEAALVLERNTGQVLYAKNADEPLYPASLTKLLTAALLLEHTEPDDVLIASREAIQVEPSAIFLQEGEAITAERALAALMLASANDVANVVAEHVAGDTQTFAAMMNELAARFGATRTVMVNPHGLHDPRHVTTARDMALIADGILREYPEIAAITSYRDGVYPLEREVEPRYLENRNRFLSMVEGAYGLKNGYTEEAGYTFIGAARRGDLDILVVVLRSQPEVYYEDAARLAEWAFDTFAFQEVVAAGQPLAELTLPRGSESTVLMAAEPVRVLAPRGMPLAVTAEIQLAENLAAPLPAGSRAGTYVGTAAGQSFVVPVVTQEDIPLVWWARGQVWLLMSIPALPALWALRLRRRRRRLAAGTRVREGIRQTSLSREDQSAAAAGALLHAAPDLAPGALTAQPMSAPWMEPAFPFGEAAAFRGAEGRREPAAHPAPSAVAGGRPAAGHRETPAAARVVRGRSGRPVYVSFPV